MLIVGLWKAVGCPGQYAKEYAHVHPRYFQGIRSDAAYADVQ